MRHKLETKIYSSLGSLSWTVLSVGTVILYRLMKSVNLLNLNLYGNDLRVGTTGEFTTK